MEILCYSDSEVLYVTRQSEDRIAEFVAVDLQRNRRDLLIYFFANVDTEI